MAILRSRSKSPRVKMENPTASVLSTAQVLDAARRAGINTTPLDVKGVAKTFGIKVKILPLDNEVSGYIQNDGGTWGIYVNALHHPRRQRFTIAHELGHYFLHRDKKQKFVDKKLFRNGETNIFETQANKFAAEILMPEEEFRNYVVNHSNKVDFIAEHFGVSALAVRVRASELGFSGHNL